MPNNRTSTEELIALAKRLRRLVLDTTHRAGMGHTGGSLSEADIMVALYWRAMQNLNPAVPRHGLDAEGIARSTMAALETKDTMQRSGS